MQLSACVIAQNEEQRIEVCLRSLSFADEIVVLDGGSQDRTREIARGLGARVYERPFDNFINQKNQLLEHARGGWVLVVDADERISDELATEIRAAIAASDSPTRDQSTQPSAFWIPRISFYLGQWIRHCGWYPEYKLRLFRRGAGVFVGDAVHENVRVTGRTLRLEQAIEHYSYANIADHVGRINRYSTAVAEQKYARGKRSSPLWAILKSISKFWITYLYHRGFMDGRAGLVVSVLAGYYNFLKYVKLWELSRMERSKANGQPEEQAGSVRPGAATETTDRGA